MREFMYLRVSGLWWQFSFFQFIVINIVQFIDYVTVEERDRETERLAVVACTQALKRERPDYS